MQCILLLLYLSPVLGITSENVPRITLPPLRARPRKQQTLQVNDPVQLAFLSNNSTLEEEKAGRLQLSVSSQVLPLPLSVPLLKARLQGKSSQEWDWKQDSQKMFVLPEEVQNERSSSRWRRVLALLQSISWGGKEESIANPPVILSGDMGEDVQYDFSSLVNSHDYSEVLRDFQREKSIALPGQQ